MEKKEPIQPLFHFHSIAQGSSFCAFFFLIRKWMCWKFLLVNSNYWSSLCLEYVIIINSALITTLHGCVRGVFCWWMQLQLKEDFLTHLGWLHNIFWKPKRGNCQSMSCVYVYQTFYVFYFVNHPHSHSVWWPLTLVHACIVKNVHLIFTHSSTSHLSQWDLQTLASATKRRSPLTSKSISWQSI